MQKNEPCTKEMTPWSKNCCRLTNSDGEQTVSHCDEALQPQGQQQSAHYSKLKRERGSLGNTRRATKLDYLCCLYLWQILSIHVQYKWEEEKVKVCLYAAVDLFCPLSPVRSLRTKSRPFVLKFMNFKWMTATSQILQRGILIFWLAIISSISFLSP